MEQRVHELEMQQLKLQEPQMGHGTPTDRTVLATASKYIEKAMLPTFIDGKNDLDSYLEYLQRVAQMGEK